MSMIGTVIGVFVGITFVGTIVMYGLWDFLNWLDSKGQRNDQDS